MSYKTVIGVLGCVLTTLWGCNVDLGIDSKLRFSCSSPDDCIEGWTCGSENVCVPRNTQDTMQDDTTPVVADVQDTQRVETTDAIELCPVQRVVAIEPGHHGLIAPDGDVTITLCETPENTDPDVWSSLIRVRGDLSGQPYIGTATVNDAQITFSPQRAFLPGEQLSVVVLGDASRQSFQSALRVHTQPNPRLSFEAMPTAFKIRVQGVLQDLDFLDDTAWPEGSLAGGRFAVGDVNGDDAVDVVYRVQTQDGIHAIFLNQNDGSFVSEAPMSADFHDGLSRSLFLADLNDDGALDLISSSDDSGVEMADILLAKGNGDGTFEAFASVGGRQDLVLQCVDYDNDGDLDILGYERLFEASDDASNRTYTETDLLTTDTGPRLAADFNNDGLLDVYVVGNAHINTSADPDSSEHFTLSNINAAFVGAETRPGTAADLNGDSFLDIINAMRGGGGEIYFNNGDPRFEPSFPSATSGLDVAIEARFGDADGDGDLDILAFRDPTHLEASVYTPDVPLFVLVINKGTTNDGIFESSLILSWPGPIDLMALGERYRFQLEFVDITGDGRLDALFSAKNSGLKVWKNVEADP